MNEELKKICDDVIYGILEFPKDYIKSWIDTYEYGHFVFPCEISKETAKECPLIYDACDDCEFYDDYINLKKIMRKMDWHKKDEIQSYIYEKIWEKFYGDENG